MKVTIKKIGNSAYLTLPEAVLVQLNLAVGDLSTSRLKKAAWSFQPLPPIPGWHGRKPRKNWRRGEKMATFGHRFQISATRAYDPGENRARAEKAVPT